jgi:hemerythrin-like domain-containing protein
MTNDEMEHALRTVSDQCCRLIDEHNKLVMRVTRLEELLAKLQNQGTRR